MKANIIKNFFYNIQLELLIVLRNLKEDWLIIAIPYFWLIIFFLAPFLIILKISFSENIVASPPFKDIAQYLNDVLYIQLNLRSYLDVVFDSFYLKAIFSSLKIAFFACIGCLLIGYGIAYGITKFNQKARFIFLLIILLPFFTSFLIRVYAFEAILSPCGLINYILLKLHIINKALELSGNDIAVCFGIIYCYLPFMVFPLYDSLIKIETDLTQAANDLGATPIQAFFKITLPLSKQGIIAGCILVFIPAIGEFVIPEVIGAPDTITIGRVLWWEFFNNRNWTLASALAIIMIVFFVIPVLILKSKSNTRKN